MIRARPYSSAREYIRSVASSSLWRVSFSKGAEGQRTENMVGVGWGLVNCTMERGGQTAPAESDCLRHSEGHGLPQTLPRTSRRALGNPSGRSARRRPDSWSGHGQTQGGCLPGFGHEEPGHRTERFAPRGSGSS